MSLAVVVTAFVLILPVELPDNSFVVTVVLTTRYRALQVWLGVSAAFLVQTVIVCAVGAAVLGRLPRTPIEVAAGLAFLVSGILLLRGAARADTSEREAEERVGRTADEHGARAVVAPVGGWRAVGMSFVLLFLAEWADLSQLLTAGLVVRYGDPLSVGVGAFLALATVSALGALLGRALLRRVRPAALRRAGGILCLGLAAVTALAVAGVRVPFP